MRLVGADLGACNDVGLAYYIRGVPVHDWPSDAWMVEIEARSDGSAAAGWDGHVLAYVPSNVDGVTAWIVDPSAAQFSSPADGLVVEWLAEPVPADFLMGEPGLIRTTRGALIIQRNPRLRRIESELAACEEFVQLLADGVMRRIMEA